VQTDTVGVSECPGEVANATNTTTSAATPSAGSGSSISGGAVAGIVIGACAGAVLLSGLLLFFVAQKRRERKHQRLPVTLQKDFSQSAKVPTSSCPYIECSP